MPPASNTMNARKEEEGVVINLTNDEALVLLDWLGRVNETSPTPLIEDQAEERVVWDLECVLETVVDVIFSKDYNAFLSEARDRLRDVTD